MILQFRRVEKKTVEEKKNFIEKCMTLFFEEMQQAKGIVDIPAFILAKQSVNEVCDTDKLINYWYRKFKSAFPLKRLQKSPMG